MRSSSPTPRSRLGRSLTGAACGPRACFGLPGPLPGRPAGSSRARSVPRRTSPVARLPALASPRPAPLASPRAAAPGVPPRLPASRRGLALPAKPHARPAGGRASLHRASAPVDSPGCDTPHAAAAASAVAGSRGVAGVGPAARRGSPGPPPRARLSLPRALAAPLPWSRGALRPDSPRSAAGRTEWYVGGSISDLPRLLASRRASGGRGLPADRSADGQGRSGLGGLYTSPREPTPGPFCGGATDRRRRRRRPEGPARCLERG